MVHQGRPGARSAHGRFQPRDRQRDHRRGPAPGDGFGQRHVLQLFHVDLFEQQQPDGSGQDRGRTGRVADRGHTRA